MTRRERRQKDRQRRQREAVFVAAAMASRQCEFTAYLPGQTLWIDPAPPSGWTARMLLVTALLVAAWLLYNLAR